MAVQRPDTPSQEVNCLCHHEFGQVGHKIYDTPSCMRVTFSLLTHPQCLEWKVNNCTGVLVLLVGVQMPLVYSCRTNPPLAQRNVM